MAEQDDETQSAKYLSNWITYKTLTDQAGKSPRIRILGRLEGFMLAGMVISNDDLSRILGEQQFSGQEVTSLAQAQHAGLRKGLDLGYNDKKEFWDAHTERLRNIPMLVEYKFKRQKDE
ncbi:MAG: hypothetical protein AABX29_01620 [Nanoarchaeota archaeon]